MVLELYRKMLLSLVPKNLEAQLKKEKGGISQGIPYILLAALVVDITFLLSLATDPEMYEIVYGGGDAAFSAVILIVILLLIPIFMVLSLLFTVGLGYVFCRILGGKGTASNQFYHFAIAESGIMMLSSAVELIPCAGYFISLLLSLYFIYPTFLIYRGVHKLSNIRAAVIALFPYVLLVLLLVLFIGFFSFSEVGGMVSQVSSPVLT